MGISLSYNTTTAVAPPVRQALEADAARVNQERNWWCEGIALSNVPGAEGKIFGDTKLFLAGYSTADGGYQQVDPADDLFLALRDAQFITACLAEWAKRYGLVWELAFEGGIVGEVSAEGADEAAGEFFRVLSANSPRSSAAPNELELIADELLRKYAGRNEPDPTAPPN